MGNSRIRGHDHSWWQETTNGVKNWAAVIIAGVLVIGTGAIAGAALNRAPITMANSSYTPIPTSTPTIEPRDVAIAFGDSWFNGADGISARHAFGFLALSDMGYTANVGGHGGTGYVQAENVDSGAPNYVDQIAQGGLDLWVDPSDVDVVLVEGGINDFRQPADQIEANAASVIGSARTQFPNARVIVVGPPTTDQQNRVDQTAEAIQDAATSAGVEFIDMRSWVTAENADDFIGEGLAHPDAEGHRALAGMLRQALTDLGVPVVTSS